MADGWVEFDNVYLEEFASALRSMFLNQSITVPVLHHWLALVVFWTFVIMVANSFLLTITISYFDGFIRRHFGLLIKFSLWSFNLMYGSCLAKAYTISAISSFSAIDI